MRSIRALPAAAGLALVVLVVAINPGAAAAATTLPDGVVVAGAAATEYSVTTDRYYWSLVAVHPQSGNVNLALFLPNGRTPLNTSALPAAKTDFVAVNSNVGARPFGAYRVPVTVASGSAAHAAQFVQGSYVIALPTPAWNGVSGASDPDINFAVLSNDDVASVADIYLTAGQKFWAHTSSAGDRLYLLESNPSQSATFTRSRGQAALATHSVVDGCTLYTATYTGWHGLAVVGDRMPTVPGAGIGYALHQWSAAKPTTCPVKNFPGATPA
jgi:hypothetical protein